MAIDVIAGDYTGRVVLRDQKADGSAVLLVCERWDPARPSTGPVVTPEPEGTHHDVGVFPIGATKPLGVLELDVSDRPSGINHFDSQRFSEAVVAQLRRGVQRLRVGTEEAKELGYRQRRGRGMTLGD